MNILNMIIFLATVHSVPGPWGSASVEKAASQVTGVVRLPSGERLATKLVLSGQGKQAGLSGVRETDFSNDQALLFLFGKDEERKIWMIDTYFNVDVIFLDESLRVVDIERNLNAHPGKKAPPEIQVSKGVVSRHILELRASSETSQKIEKGMVLEWVSSPSLDEIIKSHSRPKDK